MRKVTLILLALLLILVAGCSLSGSGEKARQIVAGKTLEPQRFELFVDVLPKDYFFVQEGDVPLTDASGEVLRHLFFQEKVFLVRKGLQRSLVEDFYGNQGFVERTLLGKSFRSNIYYTYDGADYGMFPDKNKPYANYVPVRGVYLPVSQRNRVDEFLDRLEGSVINTVIIDYKDDYDQLMFYSEAAAETVPDTQNGLVENPKEFMAKFKERGYRTIARIVVFKSRSYAAAYPESAVVTSSGNLLISDGTAWVSPHYRPMWDYIVRLSNEAIELGFDEIQYDYIRFPVLYGAQADMRNPDEETRVEAIQKFLIHAQNNISRKDVIVASDIFGWSAVSVTDEGIGQHWEAMSSVSDVICPMFYPSLYVPGNLGLSSPVRTPYETIQLSMEFALDRNSNIPTPALIRPWIQDYDALIPYGDEEVAAQVRALNDMGIEEYMLWNPDGRYSLGGLE